ncbi:MAG: dicarboxylate/amino acid:cation symporter [Phycisphaerales bacterium]|nr:dicarboxylate/amino acid:cation symporter [Phycisphaerales bacterium]
MATSGKTRLALHWKILIGLVLGVVVGVVINQVWTEATWHALGVDEPASYIATGRAHVPQGVDLSSLTRDQIAEQYPNAGAGAAAACARLGRQFNGFVGDLFLRGLKFIAVPIVLFSLIVGASSLNDLSRLGRIGLKTIGIYLCTTALAITIGLVFANVFRPGSFVNQETRESLVAQFGAEATGKIAAAKSPDVWSTVLNIVPTNPFEALAKGEMLQVVFAALLVGICLTLIPKEKAGVVIAVCDAMNDVVIKIVDLVLMLAPFAVFALIVKVVADMGLNVLGALAVYSLVVVAGLATMMFVVYPAVFVPVAKVRYGRFFRAMSPAQLLAFSSASSSATLPVTMECAQERLGVHEEVASFVLPIGATVNMDGTALYQGVAAVFIAQMYGMHLGWGDQLTIVLTATLASIGTAGVPGVGMIMLVIVLQSVGIPLEGIAVILGVDRILDMCRTSVNVTGDCMVCAVVAHSEGALESEESVRRRSASREAMGMDEQPRGGMG